ncbi:hypothetical protein IE077_001166 [Cardiosporidium cionae]|uniref:DUF6827 domain-containing protein n=1 Tax=Cardiosporidium cionae TaxID=476202 RepID=A0ABQ7J5T1_9APIC|nr:hypothetical protein IE077_001166 [Cardiosporidium cionae]|eukprot:KAF8819337.1 hypothetical protein IE077_001166 [Cardiosporidium cionae]
MVTVQHSMMSLFPLACLKKYPCGTKRFLSGCIIPYQRSNQRTISRITDPLSLKSRIVTGQRGESSLLFPSSYRVSSSVHSLSLEKCAFSSSTFKNVKNTTSPSTSAKKRAEKEREESLNLSRGNKEAAGKENSSKETTVTPNLKTSASPSTEVSSQAISSSASLKTDAQPSTVSFSSPPKPSPVSSPLQQTPIEKNIFTPVTPPVTVSTIDVHLSGKNYDGIDSMKMNDEFVRRSDKLIKEIISCNWGDYWNIVMNLPFWEAELERIQTEGQHRLHCPVFSSYLLYLNRLFDVLYQCEDITDNINEVLEQNSRSAGIAGTGLMAHEPVNNIGEHAEAITNAYETVVKGYQEFRPQIEEMVGHGIALLRQKHKFKWSSMHSYFY